MNIYISIIISLKHKNNFLILNKMDNIKILSLINDKISNILQNLMGVSILSNVEINDKIITLNYIGGSKGYKRDYEVNYILSNVNGIIIKYENLYFQINLIAIQYISKGIQLQIYYKILSKYESYFSFIPHELLAIILSYLNKKKDILSVCEDIGNNICNDNNLYLYLINLNYPQVAEYIRIINSYGTHSFQEYYKDLYFTLLDRGIEIFNANTTSPTFNELIYRIKFYINHPGVYNRIDRYMDKNLFIDIMKFYTFPYLGEANIYSIYSQTGEINTDYCENKGDYMETDSLNLELLVDCINIENNRLARLQKAILPWIGINDILTWFMIADIKSESPLPIEMDMLRNILIEKYKKTNYYKRLLDNYDNL